MDNNLSGFILIDKPAGITSHDVVNKLRKITNIKKIGHCGTLDPFATGLLLLAISRESTKKLVNFTKLDKKYIAKLKFGVETDTYDKKGQITKKYDCTKLKRKNIKEILKKFHGEQLQVPPMFSAKKINGQKLYKLARNGQTTERRPTKITIYTISIKKYKWPYLTFEIKCSSGTYIRSIAHDLGRKLNCGAYLEELRRTEIDKYKIKKAAKLERLNSTNISKKIFNIS